MHVCMWFTNHTHAQHKIRLKKSFEILIKHVTQIPCYHLTVHRTDFSHLCAVVSGSPPWNCKLHAVEHSHTLLPELTLSDWEGSYSSCVFISGFFYWAFSPSVRPSVVTCFDQEVRSLCSWESGQYTDGEGSPPVDGGTRSICPGHTACLLPFWELLQLLEMCKTCSMKQAMTKN